SADGMSLGYSPRKRVLSLQTLDPTENMDAFKLIAQELEQICGTRRLFEMDATNRMSLFTVYLRPEEIQIISNSARRRKEALDKANRALALCDEHLTALDQDIIEFVPIDGLPEHFHAHPHGYALDLAGPYLSSHAVIVDLRPNVLPVTDERCAQ